MSSSYKFGSFKDRVQRRWLDNRQYEFLVASELLKTAKVPLQPTAEERKWRAPGRLSDYNNGELLRSGVLMSLPNGYGVVLSVLQPVSKDWLSPLPHCVRLTSLLNDGVFLTDTGIKVREVTLAINSTAMRRLANRLSDVTILPTMEVLEWC